MKEKEIENLKEQHNKEILFLKENHNKEIFNLKEKISDINTINEKEISFLKEYYEKQISRLEQELTENKKISINLNEKLTNQIINSNKEISGLATNVVNSSTKISNKSLDASMSIFNSIKALGVNAQPIQYFKVDEKIINENLIKKVIQSYNDKTIGKYLGDMIIPVYKNENPSLQSAWVSNLKIHNYVLKDNNDWHNDPEGINFRKYAIKPLLDTIKSSSDSLLDKNISILNKIKDKYSHKNEIVNVNLYILSLNEIINEINVGNFEKMIMKYVSPHFKYNNNLKIFKPVEQIELSHSNENNDYEEQEGETDKRLKELLELEKIENDDANFIKNINQKELNEILEFKELFSSRKYLKQFEHHTIIENAIEEKTKALKKLETKKITNNKLSIKTINNKSQIKTEKKNK